MPVYQRVYLFVGAVSGSIPSNPVACVGSFCEFQLITSDVTERICETLQTFMGEAILTNSCRISAHNSMMVSPSSLEDLKFGKLYVEV